MINKQGEAVLLAMAELNNLPSDVVEIDGQRYRVEADGALTELGTVTPALALSPSARRIAPIPKQTGYRGSYPIDRTGTQTTTGDSASSGWNAESAKAHITATAERLRAERMSKEAILAGQPARPGLAEFYTLREIAAGLSGSQAFDLAVALLSIN